MEMRMAISRCANLHTDNQNIKSSMTSTTILHSATRAKVDDKKFRFASHRRNNFEIYAQSATIKTSLPKQCGSLSRRCHISNPSRKASISFVASLSLNLGLGIWILNSGYVFWPIDCKDRFDWRCWNPRCAQSIERILNTYSEAKEDLFEV
jgi:hypothetical protein